MKSRKWFGLFVVACLLLPGVLPARRASAGGPQDLWQASRREARRLAAVNDIETLQILLARARVGLKGSIARQTWCHDRYLRLRQLVVEGAEVPANRDRAKYQWLEARATVELARLQVQEVQVWLRSARCKTTPNWPALQRIDIAQAQIWLLVSKARWRWQTQVCARLRALVRDNLLSRKVLDEEEERTHEARLEITAARLAISEARAEKLGDAAGR